LAVFFVPYYPRSVDAVVADSFLNYPTMPVDLNRLKMKLKSYYTQNSKFFKNELKTFAVVNLATATLMILFSMVGHFLTPYKLIPSSVTGGTIGLLSGVYICFKLNYIDKGNFFPVLLSSLIYFGFISFVAVFNLNNPVLIIAGFSVTGLTTIISNRYFVNHPYISASKIYGTLGLIMAFPALYFVVASILRFQFGQNFLFHFVENLLGRTNGQANFNAITPFLFGGGLALAFGINLLSQIENSRAANIFTYKSLRFRCKTLNLIVVMLTGIVGLAILSYLAVENF
jgi:hypothetical protein